MIDYTNRVLNSLLYRRQATFKELAQFKPHFAKTIRCNNGKIRLIRLNPTRHKYWLYRCTLCGKTGITRTDRVDDFQCPCQKREQKKLRMPRTRKVQPKEKMCRICKKILPLTTKYYYRSKAGYFASYCKTCEKGRYVSDKGFGRPHYTLDECGRPIE